MTLTLIYSIVNLQNFRLGAMGVVGGGGGGLGKG